MDQHAVDQGTGSLERVGRVVGRDGPVQRLDLGPVDLGQVGVKRRNGPRHGGDHGLQLRFPGLQSMQPGLQGS
jgi:hypothetical protein